jgi:hypothetical protein
MNYEQEEGELPIENYSFLSHYILTGEMFYYVSSLDNAVCMQRK